VKEKIDTPAPMTSDNDMDLWDDDVPSLIKDRSLPPTDMDINMVFMLPAEFRGVEEEVAHMCLDPKVVVFKKSEESNQHLKPLYIWGHIYERPISRMLIDDGVAMNLMPHSVFQKLVREDDELILTSNGMGGGGQPDGGPGCHLYGAHHREQVARHLILHH
jgi:hypothetical protein